jgi:hypothetical protein
MFQTVSGRGPVVANAGVSTIPVNITSFSTTTITGGFPFSNQFGGPATSAKASTSFGINGGTITGGSRGFSSPTSTLVLTGASFKPPNSVGFFP